MTPKLPSDKCFSKGHLASLPSSHLGLTQPQLDVFHGTSQLPGLLVYQSFFMASLLQTLDSMGQTLQDSLMFTVEGLQPLAHQPSASQDLLLAEPVPCRLIPLPQHQA